ncbi:hypothetical protein AVEN_249250-1 [Araneus ventricosus]|uniref:Uncharacterized protein n=1 Tax=Araneus ventricosus TaxID=182803 RepID=A0A4Y2FAQ3_ARAVE|nr:hypothetical protein AVEN_249250-1 [Araneus ventricosus]
MLSSQKETSPSCHSYDRRYGKTEIYEKRRKTSPREYSAPEGEKFRKWKEMEEREVRTEYRVSIKIICDLPVVHDFSTPFHCFWPTIQTGHSEPLHNTQNHSLPITSITDPCLLRFPQ